MVKDYNKFDIFNLFILIFIVSVTFFSYIYQIVDSNYSEVKDNIKELQDVKNSGDIIDSDFLHQSPEDKLEHSLDDLKNSLKDVNDLKNITRKGDISIKETVLSYFSPLGKHTPEIASNVVDSQRKQFYVYVVIEDFSYVNSEHVFEVTTKFYDPDEKLISSISKTYGPFRGFLAAYGEVRNFALPVRVSSSDEKGVYRFSVYIKDLNDGKDDFSEGFFELA